MKTQPIFSACLVMLSLSACVEEIGPPDPPVSESASVEAGTIRDFDASDVTFGFFEVRDETGIDADADGQSDDAVSTLFAIASDSEGMCGTVTDFFPPPGSSDLVVFQLRRIVLDSTSAAFAEGETLTGDGADLVVSLGWVGFQSNFTGMTAGDESDATVTINKLGDTFSAQASGVITKADFGDGNEVVNVPISLTLTDAVFCPELVEKLFQ